MFNSFPIKSIWLPCKETDVWNKYVYNYQLHKFALLTFLYYINVYRSGMIVNKTSSHQDFKQLLTYKYRAYNTRRRCKQLQFTSTMMIIYH